MLINISPTFSRIIEFIMLLPIVNSHVQKRQIKNIPTNELITLLIKNLCSIFCLVRLY